MYKHAGAGWSIRPFEAADAGPCLSIFRHCLQDMPWRTRSRGQYMVLRRALSPQNAWVAEEPDAGIVGFLTLQLPQDYVDHLFVDPDWRFCGVARGLLEVARQGATGPLSLDVDTENLGARRAYEALGWQVVASTTATGKARQMRLVSPELPGRMPPAPETIYAAPAEWIARGAGAQGNLFLTGRAGTGKTTLLRKFLAEAGDKAVIVAPTGVAAMNAGGQTIHSFFKLPPRLIEPQDVRRLPNARVVRAVDTVVIDEISMVRADMLDAIDRSLKLNRGSKRPFGGVRMILSGDLHQLPPVVSNQESPILQERFGGNYFFNTPAFKEAEFALLALKHVFRQEDPRFLALLGALRSGRVTPNDEATLARLVSTRSASDASETHVVLTPNNANAFRINQTRLAELPGEGKVFKADVQGQFEEKAFPTESDLELKAGARVMLIRNDPEGRWVNGTLAHVEGFGSKSVIVKIAGHVYEIEPAAWEKYRYDFEMDTKKVKREVVGTFKQVPLRLAYAVTIHKAQGLTLDNVFIDFDSGMFAHGQAYVAFSRARTLEGLEISRPLRPRDLVLDRDAFAFGALDTIEETPNYLLAKFRKDEGVLV